MQNLPPDSAFGRSYLGARADWHTAEDLLAQIVYLLRLDLWAKADKKSRGKQPEPIESPWQVHAEQSRRRSLMRRLIDHRRRTQGGVDGH